MNSATANAAKDVMRLATGAVLMQAMAVAAEMGIGEALGCAPQSLEELANATRSQGATIGRLMRALASMGLCEQRDDGLFELTAAGSVLRRDSDVSLCDWAIWCGRYLWPEWGSLAHAVRTGESARTVMRKTVGLDHLETDARAAATFNGAMRELTRLIARSVVECCRCSPRDVVVDVAGGYGELLEAILRSYPDARGVLFDRPHAIGRARDCFAAAGLDTRCRFVTGDFFEAVPSAGDVYLLKSVLHDWDDERSASILRNCRAAMNASARLVIVECVAPSRVRACMQHQDIARRDLTMLTGPGGRERTHEEFHRLLTATRFAWSRSTPAQFGFSVIEAVPAL